jgi:hypothetical protein
MQWKGITKVINAISFLDVFHRFYAPLYVPDFVPKSEINDIKNNNLL